MAGYRCTFCDVVCDGWPCLTASDTKTCERRSKAVALAPKKAKRGGWRTCSICGRFTDRNGRCRKVYQVDPGIYEHA